MSSFLCSQRAEPGGRGLRSARVKGFLHREHTSQAKFSAQMQPIRHLDALQHYRQHNIPITSVYQGFLVSNTAPGPDNPNSALRKLTF